DIFPMRVYPGAFSFLKGGAFRSFFVLILLLSVVLTTWRVIPRVLVKVHAQGTTPIQHIVFIVKENHSFDNYFGRFPGAHGATSGLAKVNGVQQTIALTPLMDQSPDYCHVWACSKKDYDNGAMDGFNLVGACTSAPYTCYQAA